MLELPEIMTPEEAAQSLGVKRETLAVWRSTKRYPLPFLKIGKSVFYRRKDVKKFLDDSLVGID